MGTEVSKPHHLHRLNFKQNELVILDCKSQVYSLHKIDNILDLDYTPDEFKMISIFAHDDHIYIFGGSITKNKYSKSPPIIRTDIIKIHVDGKVIVKPLDSLPEPRDGHILISIPGVIFIIGGVIDNIKTRSCLKFDTNAGKVSQIADILEPWNSLLGIAFDDSTIYLFDFERKGSVIKIFKYLIKDDKWERVFFENKSKGFIYPSRAIFKISGSEILLIGEYDRFVYDVTWKTLSRYDVKNTEDWNFTDTDFQGKLDYTDEEVIYEGGKELMTCMNIKQKSMYRCIPEFTKMMKENKEKEDKYNKGREGGNVCCVKRN